jgi:hypothetical protein
MARTKGSDVYKDIDQGIIAAVELLMRDRPDLSVEAAIGEIVRRETLRLNLGHGNFESTVKRIFRRLRQPGDPLVRPTGRGRAWIKGEAGNIIREGTPSLHQPSIEVRRKIKRRGKRSPTT